jgi:hypothetical protein
MMHKILSVVSTKILFKRITAFLTLSFIAFFMGCFSTGEPTSEVAPQVEQYNLESEISQAWSGLYQDKAWKEAWKNADTKRLKQLEDEVRFTMLDVNQDMKKLYNLNKNLATGRYSSAAELQGV